MTIKLKWSFTDSKSKIYNIWGNQKGLKGKAKLLKKTDKGIQFKVTNQNYIISFNENDLSYAVILHQNLIIFQLLVMLYLGWESGDSI